MRFLLDTNVVSATAPGATALDQRSQDWLRAEGERFYLSAVTVAEIVSGIEKARRMGALARAVSLERWLESLILSYQDRMLPFDLDAARITGMLLDRARSLGQAPGFADLAIAGIAMANDLTVLTRNLRHFAPLGVPAHDPYASLPD